jgi:hypothetical protein
MIFDTQKDMEQGVQSMSESQDRITLQGKTPKEAQADLLAGESDDLTVDFTNIVNYGGSYHEGGSD